MHFVSRRRLPQADVGSPKMNLHEAVPTFYSIIASRPAHRIFNQYRTVSGTYQLLYQSRPLFLHHVSMEVLWYVIPHILFFEYLILRSIRSPTATYEGKLLLYYLRIV